MIRLLNALTGLFGILPPISMQPCGSPSANGGAGKLKFCKHLNYGRKERNDRIVRDGHAKLAGIINLEGIFGLLCAVRLLMAGGSIAFSTCLKDAGCFLDLMRESAAHGSRACNGDEG